MSAQAKGSEREGFISRWSRRKTQARDPASEAVQESSRQPSAAEDEPPELPPVNELTLESDFRGFLHPKVDEDVRRAALRKLFSDPHFNVMDGLDTYIDDYSKTEPIPPAMLAGLRQAQRILSWAEGKDEDRNEDSEEAADHGEGAPSAGELTASSPVAPHIPAIEDSRAEALPPVVGERESIARGTE